MQPSPSAAFIVAGSELPFYSVLPFNSGEVNSLFVVCTVRWLN